MTKWYEEIPYGPLTREDHDKLSLSFYDDTDRDVHRIAGQRRVRRGDYIRVKLGDMVSRAQLEASKISKENNEDD